MKKSQNVKTKNAFTSKKKEKKIIILSFSSFFCPNQFDENLNYNNILSKKGRAKSAKIAFFCVP